MRFVRGEGYFLRVHPLPNPAEAGSDGTSRSGGIRKGVIKQ